MFYLVLQLVLTWLFMFQLPEIAVQAQQAYVNNKQLDCNNHYNSTDGNICNGVSSTCLSYLTFRSSPPYYNSPTSIAYLLGSTPELIASANKISDIEIIPSNKQIIVPVNCSCSGYRLYYQHNSSYVLKFPLETYLTVANDTYQGLTTCQAIRSQNMYDARNLAVGDELKVPLRCACPTSNQTAAGFRYLLSYMITWGDSVSAIAQMFGVDEQTVLDANKLSSVDLIFPFTPILVPLRQQPAKIVPLLSPPPPPPAGPGPTLPSPAKSSNKKWVIVAVAVGLAVVAIVLLLGFVWFCYLRSRFQKSEAEVMPTSTSESLIKEVSAESKFDSRSTKDVSWSVTSEGIHDAINSLTVYKFEDLEKATEFFSEEKRIMGSSVYKAWLNGDAAAIKVIKGDVSSEINIVKSINHSNIIRLSGICSPVKNGNNYLVYEFAENGSLHDWLHSKLDESSSTLTWKQRAQIAYDIADALNYLHNYTNPPYIHKNLKSSNVLLDSNMRSKISNFASARILGSGDDFVEEEEGVRVQMTRHVIGTQGYMAPEYMENGLITPKLDVFAFGVVMLELLSGKEAIFGVGEKDNGGKKELLLSSYVSEVLEGDNVREKLQNFVDPNLRGQYPLDLAFSMAQLARECVGSNLGRRPAMPEIFMTMSKILSSSLDWDPSIVYATYDSDPDTR